MATPEQPTKQPTPPRRRAGAWWFVAVAVALFAINYWVGSSATKTASRVRVPYSPFFVDQISGGNVAEITSKGTAIQGEFKQARSLDGSKATTRFETEIPAFANTDALSKSLQQARVVVNAKPLQTSLPWWENLLLNFGPTLLFLGLLILLFR